MKIEPNHNYWDNKPYWCQPWTILITGVLLCLFIAFLFNNLLITILTVLLTVTWWILFLVIAPSAYKKMTTLE